MKLRHVVLALAMSLPVVALADATSQQAIRDLEQAQARAAIARDRAALERIFAPDFRIINPAGAVSDRDGLFAVLLGGTSPYASAVYETQELRDLGDTLVTVGLETVVMASGPQAGQTVKRRITHVWHREDAAWRLKLRHATIVQ
jgi:uncharacterized protein (TIGR02246 family)